MRQNQWQDGNNIGSVEEDDDLPVGRLFTRREAFVLLGRASLLGFASVPLMAGCGGAGTTAVATVTTPTPTPTPVSLNCVACPAVEEGPYFVDEKLSRSDVRTDPSSGVAQTGLPIFLTIPVANVTSSCAPITGATVDIWSANALGVYSDEASEGTAGNKALRGYQATDANGAVSFTTLYPGWYSGRTAHIHVKVRFTQNGTNYVFNTQLFFDDAITNVIYTLSPYSNHTGRDTTNSTDSLYQSQLQLALTRLRRDLQHWNDALKQRKTERRKHLQMKRIAQQAQRRQTIKAVGSWGVVWPLRQRYRSPAMTIEYFYPAVISSVRYDAGVRIVIRQIPKSGDTPSTRGPSDRKQQRRYARLGSHHSLAGDTTTTAHHLCTFRG